jgi:glycosyltransferase involved in cell wall biosynthesis
MTPVDKEPRRLTVVNIVEEGRYGGPQQRITGVAARLQADHGIDTVVVLPAAGSDRFQQVLLVAGVQSRVIQLHRLTRDVVHLAGYLFFFVSEVRAIRSVIRSVRPDVVHCNGSWQVKGMVAACLAGVRRVWHLNDTFMPAMVRPLFRVVYRLCPPDGVVASSRRTLQYYFGGRPGQPPATWVIPPPVDTVRFDPALDVPCPYPDAGFEGVRVLSVGNVNPVKDHGLFIRLAHELNARGRSARLRFYVAGAIFENQRAYYESLRALAARLRVENLVFLGTWQDVPALLRHADIFVCTSKHETGPMVVWEALSMAKPVLSTDVGDVRELFEAHRCGLVAEGRDPRELADLLERFIDRPDEAAAMAKNGRAAAALVDVGHAAAQHAACYRELAGC